MVVRMAPPNRDCCCHRHHFVHCFVVGMSLLHRYCPHRLHLLPLHNTILHLQILRHLDDDFHNHVGLVPLLPLRHRLLRQYIRPLRRDNHHFHIRFLRRRRHHHHSPLYVHPRPHRHHFHHLKHYLRKLV